MPITEQSYNDLKEYWDFQRKIEFNKDQSIFEAIEKIEKEHNNHILKETELEEKNKQLEEKNKELEEKNKIMNALKNKVQLIIILNMKGFHSNYFLLINVMYLNV